MKTKLSAITKTLNRVNDRMPASICANESKQSEGPARILFAQHAPALAELAERHGLKLPGPSLTDMLEAIDEANQLAPLSRRLTSLLARAEDQRLLARSNAWKHFTQIYSVVSCLARHDVLLADQLEEVKRFFSNKSRRDQ